MADHTKQLEGILHTRPLAERQTAAQCCGFSVITMLSWGARRVARFDVDVTAKLQNPRFSRLLVFVVIWFLTLCCSQLGFFWLFTASDILTQQCHFNRDWLSPQLLLSLQWCSLLWQWTHNCNSVIQRLFTVMDSITAGPNQYKYSFIKLAHVILWKKL